MTDFAPVTPEVASRRLSGAIRRLFADAVRLNLRHPARALSMFRMLLRQKAAARVRQAWQAKGLQVPAFMIVSVTRRCNLRCRGCYAHALRPAGAKAELSEAELRRLLDQAGELGISIVLLAGGEPLTRPDLLQVTRDYPNLMFVLFTNGLLLDTQTAARLAAQPHVVPVLSFEGHRGETDRRRGDGVYERLLQATADLRRRGVFFGASLTVTQANFATVTGDEYVSELLSTGGRLFFYVEYVPVEPGTEDLTLNAAQRRELPQAMDRLRTSHPGLFIALPGDEEAFGGCLAAGRGFIHVNPEGSVEPCPFAPFADVSLRDRSLQEALRSPFLGAVRESHELLGETKGGCALWANREWVRSLLPAAGSDQSAQAAAPAPPSPAADPAVELPVLNTPTSHTKEASV